MKRFVSFLICTCLIFLSGCDKKDERKVIKFSAWGSQSETAILKPILEEFEKENPDVKVVFVHVPQNYFQKLHLLFASNLAPDVVFLNNFYSKKYINAGLLEDLTPHFENEKKDFFEKSIESSSYKGRLYVVPRDISDLVVYYNKDIFKKYNIPFPKKDWTIQDYIITAKKLTRDTNGDGKTDIWGTGFEREAIYWLPFMFSNGGGVFSDDGSAVIINSPESIKSLDTYVALVNKYKIAPDKSQSASLTMAQLFIQGKIAMQISGRWLVPKYRSDIKFDWDVVNFPKGSKGSIVGLDSSGYAVSKSSKYKEESIRLIKYLSSKKSVEQLAQSGLIVPARKDAAYSKAFLAPDKKPQNAVVFLEAIQTAKPTPVNEDYQKITDILNTALEPVFLGEKSAEDVLNEELVQRLKQ